MSDLLESVDCPTLVLCGEEDQITPPNEMRTMAGRIPQATFHLIPHAGHLAPAENPDDFNQQVRCFLS
jgi:pimeloyl-ACP methyl ester carboxylesterase